MQDFTEEELKYLKLLSIQYQTIDEASAEIINLQAILNLPKGTEHFLADIHGENEPFEHMLKNASGVIKGEIEQIWGNTLSTFDKKRLATLIYYPERKIDIILSQENNIDDWHKITLHRLIEICRSLSSKYTRSKVRKAMPKNFTYILEELLNTDVRIADKTKYYKEIINTITKIGCAKEFIIAISNLIQRLAIDRLHIIGDIYDRGPGADKIMESLISYHSIDIQWGNHDILWMGAASGSDACIANVLRICARYGNLDIIEDAYGINLLPLATFAMEFYKNDKCTYFMPKIINGLQYQSNEIKLFAQMHKAITIIQFKLEHQAILRHPDYEMKNRLLLGKIDYKDYTIELNGKVYPLMDKNFPTIDPEKPYMLSQEEMDLMEKLRFSFTKSEKLKKHVRFLYSKGSLYQIYNSNLLFHGCIPLDENGDFRKVKLNGKLYSGKQYLDYLDIMARKAFFNNNAKDKYEYLDLIWYLWCGPHSPLFGKNRMATFESYLIDDNECKTEKKDPYYLFREKEDTCRTILKQFGLDPYNSHIINGHVPVEKKNGESPIKANGILISIDGGLSKAYQKTTGIAGYTLIYDSYGLMLVSHEPFKSTEAAIEEETDIHSSVEVFQQAASRVMVKDTDVGAELHAQIQELKKLLSAYKKGLIKEQIKAPKN